MSCFSWENQEIFVIRKSELHPLGYELIFPVQLKDKLQEQLEGTEKIESVSEEAFQILRVENERPLLGMDFTSRNNPVEIDLRDAYSLNKGCYVGQEVISKATHIGKTARKRTLIFMEGSEVPAPGDMLYSVDGQEIGKITSVVYSPRLDKPIGFAFLKRAFTEINSKCFLKDNGEHGVSVVERFE